MRHNRQWARDWRDVDEGVEAGFLEAYADARNARYIDRIMRAIAPDCVFEAAGGKADYGVRSVGQNAVRDRFVAVWNAMPTAECGLRRRISYEGAAVVRNGRFGGEDRNGREVRFSGCDFFTFRDGKIKTKHTFLKSDLDLGRSKKYFSDGWRGYLVRAGLRKV